MKNLPCLGRENGWRRLFARRDTGRDILRQSALFSARSKHERASQPDRADSARRAGSRILVCRRRFFMVSHFRKSRPPMSIPVLKSRAAPIGVALAESPRPRAGLNPEGRGRGHSAFGPDNRRGNVEGAPRQSPRTPRSRAARTPRQGRAFQGAQIRPNNAPDWAKSSFRPINIWGYNNIKTGGVAPPLLRDVRGATIKKPPLKG